MNQNTTTVYEDMFEAASLCGKLMLETPALVILYSLLDTLAWAAYGEKMKGGQKRFERFCNEYKLPQALGCSETDLYSSRCSILHNLGWESDLSKAGKAKSFYYHFGASPIPKSIPKVAASFASTRGQLIEIHADELFNLIRDAHNKLIESSKQNSELETRLRVTKEKQYRVIDTAEIDSLFKKYLAKSENPV